MITTQLPCPLLEPLSRILQITTTTDNIYIGIIIHGSGFINNYPRYWKLVLPNIHIGKHHNPRWNHYGTTVASHPAIGSQTWNSSSVRVVWMNSKCSDMNFPMHPAAQTTSQNKAVAVDLKYVGICVHMYMNTL